MKTLLHIFLLIAIVLAGFSPARVFAQQDAEEHSKKMLKSICELPLWRSDRVFNAQEWHAYGICAKDFQSASVDLRFKIVKSYQSWLKEEKAVLSKDGRGYYPSQIFLLLRICYRVEDKPKLVSSISRDAKDGMYPLQGKDNQLQMIGTVTWGSGIYLPEVDFKVIHRIYQLRDLKSCKIKLSDGTLMPLIGK